MLSVAGRVANMYVEAKNTTAAVVGREEPH